MKHTTKKAKAVTFLTNKAEKIKIGPHSTLEYFILSAILNGEGVLSNGISTRLSEDDLECLYNRAVMTVRRVTLEFPVYQRESDFLLRLSKVIKGYYNYCTARNLS